MLRYRVFKDLTRLVANITLKENPSSILHPPVTPCTPAISSIKIPVIQRRIDEPTGLPKIIIDHPSNVALQEINDILHRNKRIEEPTTINNTEKHAVRMIVIRKRKMRKHKLKKLRKKMKFEWGRLRQRREMRKEKAFQAELLAQIKDAEKFSAEEYVAEKLRKATETPIPRFWKGKRLPEFIIKEKLGIK